MTRISNNAYFDTMIRNIQDSFRDLTKLQNQLQTQKLLEKPSDDPITANQAIRLERNLSEVTQYQENVETGSEFLTYSDQILSNLQVPLNTALEKAQQGLNAELSETERSAISAEIQSILDTIVSVGNTTLGDKSIFGGHSYIGQVFQFLGDDVLFNGDDEVFNINVFGNESIQANISATQAFGAMGTLLESNRDLDPRISPLKIQSSVPLDTTTGVTNKLVLKEGDHSRSSSLSITLTSANSTNTDTLVKAINDAVATAAGKDGTGTIDNSTIKTTAKTATQTAFLAAGASAAQNTALGTAIDAITVTGATTSLDFEAAVRAASITALGKTATTLTATETNIVEAAQLAARNSFASVEFHAAKTRSGLVISHKTGEQVSIDEGQSTKRAVTDLELNGKVNSSSYQYRQAPATTNLAADRTMTLTSKTGSLSIKLYQGDTASVIARRINQAVNAATVDSDIRQIVADANTSETPNKLELVSNKFFDVQFDNNTEFSNATAISYSSISGQKNNIDDLRGGISFAKGSQKIMADNSTTGYISNMYVQEGDSLDYIIEQLNNLKGFEASLNTAGTGIDLQNVANYSASVTPTNPAAPPSLKIASVNSGFSSTITFTGTSVSQMAEEINAASSTNFRFHAEVNSAGTGLIITSNEKFTTESTDTAMTVITSGLTDHSADTLLSSSTILTGLGLNSTFSSTGSISGENLLTQQTRLSVLNDGQGVTAGSLRFTLGTSSTDVDLSSAKTLRDVKELVEKALSNAVQVTINNAENGIAIKSNSTTAVRVEELNGGSMGRHLGIIQAPLNSATGTDIQGGNINPRFRDETLLKDLNSGQGVDLTGFIVQNGQFKTTITFDSDGDGINDIRSLQELVNHINQKSKQDNVYIEASINDKTGKLKIVSKLSNTSLQIKEEPVAYDIYKAGSIASTSTDAALKIKSADSSQTITVDLTGSTGAADIISKINTAAALTTTNFSFKAQLKSDGSVEVVSNENISLSDSTKNYETDRFIPNPPVFGSTASDLGLLGAFSESTLLTSLNNGNGIENGSFKLKYGSKEAPTYSTDGVVAGTVNETVNFYNENGSSTASFVMTAGLSSTALATAFNADANFIALGLKAEVSPTGVKITSSNKFTMSNATTTTTKYVTQIANSGTLKSTAKEVTVDLEFAETLGDVKRAVEAATNSEVLVSFGKSSRIEFTIASGDDNQTIEFSEINSTSDVAGSLGLTSKSILKGRELKNGTTDLLTSATKLSELGLNINTSAATNSTENHLVLVTPGDTTSINLSSFTTVGDVISAINGATTTDNGNTISFLATIENGSYLSVKNQSGTSIHALSSGFSDPAEKLGFTTDPNVLGEAAVHSEDLSPTHHADNFFSSLTILRDEFKKGTISQSVISGALSSLERVNEKFLIARGETGSRINRFETLKTRFEEEKLNLTNILGEKTTIDIIEVTQKFLEQQQIYEAGLSSASRVLGLSLFSFI